MSYLVVKQNVNRYYNFKVELMYIESAPYPFEVEAALPLWIVMIFIVGACMGSFLNVCIWRIPREESIVHPPSRCPKCGHRLAWFENFPIFGWLLLRGKCRSCRSPISVQYLLMEILVGLLFSGVAVKVYSVHEPLIMLIPYFVATSLVVTTFFIDIRHYIIPNLTTYPAMLAGLILAAVFPEYWGFELWWQGLAASFISLAAVYLLLAAFAYIGEKIFKQEALGGGDVKYMAAVSALLGLKCAFFTILLGSVTGSVFGLVMMAVKKKKMNVSIPLGPFLATATYIWILCGDRFFEWYFSLKLF